MRQLLLNIFSPPQPSFANFITGANAEMQSSLLTWLSDGGASAANPNVPTPTDTGFYLFGPQGSGKTHLLKASQLTYLDALADPSLEGLSDAVEHIAVDNIDQLNATGQQCLFNLFNRLLAVRKAGGRAQLLFSGQSSPGTLSIREDTRTRVGYGQIYKLQLLDDEDKLRALTQIAHERHLRIGPELLTYLICHTARDMGSLTALLLALDQYSLEHQRLMTLPLLRELLNQYSGHMDHETRPV